MAGANPAWFFQAGCAAPKGADDRLDSARVGCAHCPAEGLEHVLKIPWPILRRAGRLAALLLGRRFLSNRLTPSHLAIQPAALAIPGASGFQNALLM
jgi:hypothetical protein